MVKIQHLAPGNWEMTTLAPQGFIPLTDTAVNPVAYPLSGMTELSLAPQNQQVFPDILVAPQQPLPLSLGGYSAAGRQTSTAGKSPARRGFLRAIFPKTKTQQR